MPKDSSITKKQARETLGRLIKVKITAAYGTFVNFAYKHNIAKAEDIEGVSQGRRRIDTDLAKAFSEAFGGSEADWINAENKILADEPVDVPLYETFQQKQQEGGEVPPDTSSDFNSSGSDRPNTDKEEGQVRPGFMHLPRCDGEVAKINTTGMSDAAIIGIFQVWHNDTPDNINEPTPPE